MIYMKKELLKGLTLLIVLALSFNLIGCQKKTPVPTEPVPEEAVIYKNGNISGVLSQPSNPTTFAISESYKITYISNYHYFNRGALPGTISLKHQDGTVYGPWQTEGAPGQGNVQNAYWIVRPNQVIKAGTYTVIDSDPSTWSQNSGSKNQGFTEIKGYQAKE